MKPIESPSPSSRPSFLQIVLGSLLLFMAMNAFGGGCYGLTGAKDVPVDWLKNSPFHTYFTPSVVLFVVVGGAALIAGLMVFSRHPSAKKAATISALIIFVWLAVQVAMIGYVSWLQPAVAIAGLLIFVLSRKLPSHEN